MKEMRRYMNPIDLVKTQFEPIGLNHTQIKGALFLLAGINSVFKVDSSMINLIGCNNENFSLH